MVTPGQLETLQQQPFLSRTPRDACSLGKHTEGWDTQASVAKTENETQTVGKTLLLVSAGKVKVT